jgi:hypothetical protein
MTAQEYLDKLPMYQWLSIIQAPEELQEALWLIIELNQCDTYRITQHELQSNLFMKTKKTEKEQLLSSLAELGRGIGTVDWIYISTPETGYIVSIQKDGKIRNMDNPDIHKIFIPKTNIQDYFEWVYKHAKTIKIRYLDE